MSFRIPIGRYVATEAEKKAVMAVMESGILSPGPKVREFEQQFARFVGGSDAVLVNSGTDALRLALLALKERLEWPEGSEVIVPALTFVATANVVLQAGLKPVFVDVTDSHSDRPYCLDPKLIAKAISSKTRCILPVHLFGCQADMEGIYKQFVQWPRLVLVEDGCESLIPKSAYSEYAAYSFYVCHLMTMGVGGIAVSHNPPGMDESLRSLANHGRDPHFLGTQVTGKPDYLTTRFSFVRNGYSSRATEIQAAIGLEQLKTIKAKLATRKANAQKLYDKLCSTPDKLSLVNPANVKAPHSWMMFPVVLADPSIHRDDFCEFLETCGIETRPLMPLLSQPFYINTFGALEMEKHPIAKRVSKRGFYITCDEHLDLAAINYIAEVFRGAFQNVRKVAQVA